MTNYTEITYHCLMPHLSTINYQVWHIGYDNVV